MGYYLNWQAMKKINPLYLICLMSFSGCSSYDYHVGKFEDGIGNKIAAFNLYNQFLNIAPNSSRAVEVKFRLGNIESQVFHRCDQAVSDYESVTRNLSPQNPWFQKAVLGILNCPDYFPLESGRTWVYGDSLSRGKNMKDEWKALRGKEDKNAILSSLYAGKNLVRQGKLLFQKKDWAVFRIEGASAVPILKYPFHAGQRWEFSGGKNGKYFEIVSTSSVVKTAAGVFSGCLKVKEAYGKFPRSWKYTYYAPFVGEIKTTIAGPGFESPNTELIRYQ